MTSPSLSGRVIEAISREAAFSASLIAVIKRREDTCGPLWFGPSDEARSPRPSR